MHGIRWVVGIFLLGGLIVWVWLAQRDLLAARLPQCVADTAVSLVVDIDHASAQVASQPTFPVEATIVQGRANCAELATRRVRLNWPMRLVVVHEAPKAGDRWKLEAKLRPPWKLASPGAFDFERWMLSQRLDGSGYVISAELRLRPIGAESLRTNLESAIKAHAPYQAPLLQALALGDSSELSATSWEVLRDTGTIHLVVVSGLHVGAVGLIGYVFTAWFWRLLPGLSGRLTTSTAGGSGAVVAAWSFAVYTGLGVPVVRAATMLTLGALALLLRQRLSRWLMLAGALGCSLLAAPHALLANGFWLSYGAVAVLFVCLGGRFITPHFGIRVCSLLRLQGLLWLGMLPLMSRTVGMVSLLAPLLNPFAVPVVTFVLVPGLLVTSLLTETPRAALLTLLDWVAHGLMQGLASTAVRPAHVLPDVGLASCLAAGVGALTLLYPCGLRRVPFALGALALVFIPAEPRLPFGEFEVTVLDVGQGSSTLVRTRNEVVVFDMGARYQTGFDLGARVVVPAVLAHPMHRVNHLIASHFDNDHAGGLASVRAAFPQAEVVGNGRSDVLDCHGFPAWWQDGVAFRFLSHPALAQAGTDNDRSCWLLVVSENASALLTGDSSARVEALALRDLAHPVDFLVAPHHGSLTSSSIPLIRKTQPIHVAISSGHLNRYGHPHAEVVARYRLAGAQVWQTARSGALIWRSDNPSNVIQWRQATRWYWTNSANLP